MQDLWIVSLSTLASIAVLFALSKLIGYRQISELSVFDYINSITIGSLAAEMAHATDKDVFYWLIPMVIYGIFTYLLAVVTDRSRRLRRVVTGMPIVLMENGTLYQENFKKAKLDVDEFLSECRAQGYFDLSELHSVVMEPTGKLSILPRSTYHPVTPADLQLTVSEQSLSAILITDGEISRENLRKIGRDENWLKKELATLGSYDPEEIFLATYTDGTLNVFRKEPFSETKNVIF